MSRKTKVRGFKIKEEECINYHLIYAVSCTTPPQLYHTGVKLEETVKIINKFKNATIVLCDTLQRHTMMIDKLHAMKLLGKEVATADAYELEIMISEEIVKARDNWKNENSSILNKITIPFKFINWLDVLNSDKFITMDRLIHDSLQTYELYRQALKESSDHYIKNKFSLTEQAYQHARLYADTYVNEETAAVLSWSLPANELFPNEENKVLLYPTKLNQAMYVAGDLTGAPKLLPNIWLDFPRKFKKLNAEDGDVEEDIVYTPKNKVELKDTVKLCKKQFYSIVQLALLNVAETDKTRLLKQLEKGFSDMVKHIDY